MRMAFSRAVTWVAVPLLLTLLCPGNGRRSPQEERRLEARALEKLDRIDVAAALQRYKTFMTLARNNALGFAAECRNMQDGSRNGAGREAFAFVLDQLSPDEFRAGDHSTLQLFEKLQTYHVLITGKPAGFTQFNSDIKMIYYPVKSTEHQGVLVCNTDNFAALKPYIKKLIGENFSSGDNAVIIFERSGRMYRQSVPLAGSENGFTLSEPESDPGEQVLTRYSFNPDPRAAPHAPSDVSPGSVDIATAEKEYAKVLRIAVKQATQIGRDCKAEAGENAFDLMARAGGAEGVLYGEYSVAGLLESADAHHVFVGKMSKAFLRESLDAEISAFYAPSPGGEGGYLLLNPAGLEKALPVLSNLAASGFETDGQAAVFYGPAEPRAFYLPLNSEGAGFDLPGQAGGTQVHINVMPAFCPQ